MRRYLDILREHAAKSAAFVQELQQLQDQNSKVWSEIALHVTPNDFEAGDVNIDSIAKHKEVLPILVDLADKHGVSLRFEIDERTDVEVLKEWYRHGFEVTGEFGKIGLIMIRQPW